MKDIKEVLMYFNNIYDSHAIYIWGGNGEIITKELCDKLYKTYGSSKYNKAYYDSKFIEGQGKIGADCSGVMMPMSGYDATATSYYNKCVEKGKTNGTAPNIPCLVFKTNSDGSIKHMGFYMGDGTVVEMKSSIDNCKRNVFNNTWTLYGIPEWINYNTYIKAIDISTFNEIINWDSMKSEINDIIIRIGYRGYSNGGIKLDAKFNSNFNQAKMRNMNIGVYFFDQSINEKEAEEQAEWVVNNLAGNKLYYPIFIDSEYSNTNHNGRGDLISKEQRTKNIIAFCNKVQSLGYKSGVYASENWFKTMLNFEQIKHFNIWCAKYSKNKPNISKYDAWQYGSENFAWAKNAIDVNQIYGFETVKPQQDVIQPQDDNYSVIAIVNTKKDNLNIREGYGTNYKVIGSYPKGTKVQVIGYNSGWIKTKDGWCSAQYIKFPQGQITASALNIRQGYGTEYPKIGLYKNGEVVDIILYYNGWYRTDKGWVCSKYVRLL